MELTRLNSATSNDDMTGSYKQVKKYYPFQPSGESTAFMSLRQISPHLTASASKTTRSSKEMQDTYYSGSSLVMLQYKINSLVLQRHAISDNSLCPSIHYTRPSQLTIPQIISIERRISYTSSRAPNGKSHGSLNRKRRAPSDDSNPP